MGDRGNITRLLFLSLICLSLSLQSPCVDQPNCSLSVGPCSQKYIICISGLEQNASCGSGQVFFNKQCVKQSESPECSAASDSPSTTTPTLAPTTPSTDFDCTSRADGQYSLGCTDKFVNCVSGQAYVMFCPTGLVYAEQSEMCQHTCDATTTTEVPTTLPTTTTTTTTTTEATTTTTEAFTTTTEETTTEELTTEAPTTTTTAGPADDSSSFNCNGRVDGAYATGCAETFVYCVDGSAFTSYCPSALVFNAYKGRCDYDCTSTEEPTTTTHSSTTRTSTTTTTTEKPETTTFATLAPSDDDAPTTTQTPIITSSESVCFNNEVTIFGNCPTHFVICQDNELKSKQCPAATIYDTGVFLCTYGNTGCETAPSYVSPFASASYPQQQPPNSPVVQSYVPTPFYRQDPPYPFAFGLPRRSYLHPGEQANFIPNVVLGEDGFQGPLNPYLSSDINTVYPPSPVPRGFDVFGRPVTYLNGPRAVRTELEEDDLLTHHRPSFKKFSLQNKKVTDTSSEAVETTKTIATPLDITSKKIDDVVEIESSGDVDENENTVEGSGSDDSELPTRRKRSYGSYAPPTTSYNNNNYFGNPYGAYNQPSNVYGGSNLNSQEQTRLANLNVYCQGISVPTFLYFGQCQSDFVYCSGTGVNKLAACPIGELFDNVVNKCLTSCGLIPAPVTTTQVPATVQPVIVLNPTTTSLPESDDQSSVTTTSPVSVPNVIITSTSVPPIVDTSICQGLETGPYSFGGCSEQFVYCLNGAAIERTCPTGLYFDTEQARCDFIYNVAACNEGEVTTTTTAAIVSATTENVIIAETTTLSAPAQYQPETTTLSAPSQDQPETTTRVLVVPTTQTVQVSPEACISQPDGIYPAAVCSTNYIQCVAGATHVLSCPSELIFDQSSNACQYPEEVEGCSSAPATSQTSEVTTYKPETTTPSDDAITNAPIAVSSSDACHGVSDGVLAHGCSATYIVCYQGVTQEHKTCPVGQAYNAAVNCCSDIAQVAVCTISTSETPSEDQPIPVEVEHTTTETAQQEATTTGFTQQDESTTVAVQQVETTTEVHQVEETTTVAATSDDVPAEDEPYTVTSSVAVTTTTATYAIVDDRCRNAATNSVRVSGVCRPSYIKCINGQSVVEYCGLGKIFSVAHGCCVARSAVAECATTPVAQLSPSRSQPPPSSTQGSHPFCLGKVDGLYKNPTECSGILQCFGGDLFEYPSCPSNLAFNEKTGYCDYPQNVESCSVSSFEIDNERCIHGTFLEDPTNCSQFYRCVWGHRVAMACPASTVFNPALSVCDWPDQVPSCMTRSHSPKFSRAGNQ